MKTLANCSPREFLVQTNKIRKSVANWLTLTGIMEIRKTLPDMPKDISEEDRGKAIEKQIHLNLKRILDVIMDEHPEETAELLGLLCFIDPEDLDNHEMKEILASITDIIGSPEVIGFFTSLAKADLINTFDGARV